jgi:hypothetical protein
VLAHDLLRINQCFLAPQQQGGAGSLPQHLEPCPSLLASLIISSFDYLLKQALGEDSRASIRLGCSMKPIPLPS